MTNRKHQDEVPLFKSWRGWYLFVLGFLIALIVFFYFFTKHFS